ncbi:MAG TPA: YfhO family protein [Vicinamibacterales bacterium]
MIRHDTPTAQSDATPDGRRVASSLSSASWLPVLLVLVVSTLPVAGMFTLTRVFFVRDLVLSFRSRFFFLRHAVWSGTFPFWDPYVANGQPAVNDALYQLFHLPSLPIRLLLPELVAYNLWVGLPVPLAGLGMYAFLRRQSRPSAAAFGAVAYALSGTIVSSTNFPNLSWSVAAVPYVFWALERLIERGTAAATALFALMIALQALAGEPVTLAATLVIAGAYAALPEGRWRRPQIALLAAAGEVAGVLLAAVQYVPLLDASRHSLRALAVDVDFWAFHPLALFELAVPHFFGDFFHSNLRETGWMLALNSGRDPFYYSMYIGVPVAMLAAVAAISRRPRTIFWTAVIAACAIASLGRFTPVYPLLRELIPPLRSFRFPVKYLSLSAFGIATLAAFAFEWLLDRDVPRRPLRGVLVAACLLAALAYGFVAWVLIAPALPIRACFELARWAHVPNPIQGAEFVLYRARPLFSALMLKLLCTAFLLWVAASARREWRLALGVLGAMAVVDLLGSNAGVNPTIDARLIAAPAWTEQIPHDSHERVYVGGRLEGYVNTTDVDAPRYARYLDEYDELTQRFLIINQFLFNPSGAAIRESLSFDLPVLWPTEFARAGGWFQIAPRADRLRYLQRVGTRFVVLPTPPYPGAKPLAQLVSAEQEHLYDAFPGARRAYVVGDALLGPSVEWQIQGMFQERFDPSTGVLVSDRPPPPAGMPGAPVPKSADFLEDGLNRVVIRAGLPGDGYLALLDTYNPDWRVAVDGTPAPMIRADGLFRAVHLTRGSHVVSFTYHPSAFYLGAQISAVTALLLGLSCLVERRRR